jgi:hypothetical protein
LGVSQGVQSAYAQCGPGSGIGVRDQGLGSVRNLPLNPTSYPLKSVPGICVQTVQRSCYRQLSACGKWTYSWTQNWRCVRPSCVQFASKDHGTWDDEDLDHGFHGWHGLISRRLRRRFIHRRTQKDTEVLFVALCGGSVIVLCSSVSFCGCILEWSARTASRRAGLATIHFIHVACVERAVWSQSRGASWKTGLSHAKARRRKEGEPYGDSALGDFR